MKFTRRQILSGPGAGLATAALGIISFSSSKAYSSGTWDYESDVVVVGSGIGGATAAFKANQNQDSVIVVEKAAFFGGTSMKTAGVIWVPNNFSLRDKGIKDSKKECIQLLARHSYPEQYNAESENLGLTTAAVSYTYLTLPSSREVFYFFFYIPINKKINIYSFYYIYLKLYTNISLYVMYVDSSVK